MTDEMVEPKLTPLSGDKKGVPTPIKSHQPSAAIKYGSLLTLTAINSASGLSLRHSQIRAGDKFIPSSVVVMVEVAKLAISLCLVACEDRSLCGVYRTVVKQPLDTLKVCLPSLLYVLHNNVLYVGARHLDASTFLVTCRLKILTTAVFAYFMLKQSFRALQLLGLAALIGGVILVQLAQTKETIVVAGTQNRLLGFAALTGAAMLSGFSGIYFEKILKGSDVSVWMRNVQLSSISLPLSLVTCLGSSWTQIVNDGFFFGYDWFVLWLILVQSGGGLTVAVVIKYADNILKCFASSLSIVIASVVSIFLFGLQVTWMLSAGVAVVIASAFIYNYQEFNCAGDEVAGMEEQEQAASTGRRVTWSTTWGWPSIAGLFRRASMKKPDPSTTGADLSSEV